MIDKVRRQLIKLNDIKQSLDVIKRQNDELLFANIFRDSIQSTAWLHDKSFSPYRSAANYSLLYKLFKIYDVYRPQSTLEFGLGQSTKLTAQYVASNKKAKALVIDDSQAWIDIFKAETQDVAGLDVKKLPLRDFVHKETRVIQGEYDNLEKTLGRSKFNLVIVDGPIGFEKEYSRTNILGIIENLASDWVVIFDDAERSGEQNTMALFREELDKRKEKYFEFSVPALKTQHYFCSPKLSEMLISI